MANIGVAKKVAFETTRKSAPGKRKKMRLSPPGRQHDQLSLGAGLSKTSRGSRQPLLPHLDLLCITCTERTSRIFNEVQKLPNMEVLSTHL